jgi:hypothetical protein
MGGGGFLARLFLTRRASEDSYWCSNNCWPRVGVVLACVNFNIARLSMLGKLFGKP